MGEYSDDDFDDLDPIALQELEKNAIQFTQALTQGPRATPSQGKAQVPSNYDDLEFEDDDLDDSEVINGLLPPPAAHRPHSLGADQARQLDPPQRQQTRPAPPAAPTASRPPPQGLAPNPRPNYPGASQHHHGPRYPVSSQAGYHQPTHSQQPLPPYRRPVPLPRHAPTSSSTQRPARPSQTPASAIPPAETSNDAVAQLQQRIKALESEVYAAKGEVAIVRSNATKAEEQHATEMTRLKKLNAEQESKNQRLVEQAVAAEKNATTELQFLQRDLQETNHKSRRRDSGLASNPGPGFPTTMTTPKKTNKTWGMADGFDEVDIVLSPSKGRGKTRDSGAVAVPIAERTPTKGKRKRPTVDSPVMALETHEGDFPMAVDSAALTPESVHERPLCHPRNDLPFEYLQMILDHSSPTGESLTFENLSRYHYPSDPKHSFSALIFQRMPLLGNSRDPMKLLVDFCGLILDMWHRCLEETYYQPIRDLVSLLAFSLQLQTKDLAPHLINDLVPAAEKTIYIVAEARYKGTKTETTDEALEALQLQIDTTFLLSVLRLTAMASVTSTTTVPEMGGAVQTRQFEFWRMMPVDFVLILLTPNQLLADVLGMLELLCMSVLPESIGPIVQHEEPEATARMVIEKVSSNLIDVPRKAVTPRERHAIGLGVLRTMAAFAQSPFGALQLVVHANAVPRLVTSLSSLVDELYDINDPVHVSIPVDAEDVAGEGRGASISPDGHGPVEVSESSDEDLAGLHTLIKQIVVLLHGLVTDVKTAHAVNIQSKIAMAYGGSQRYILALSRIHFAEEDLIYEAGIDEETAELARELCELVVTPDEGEGVRQAFGA